MGTYNARIKGSIGGEEQDFAAIREWRRCYEAIIMAGGHILYDWNSETNEVAYGGSLKKTLGYTMEEMDGGLRRWMELIHPEDRDYFSQSIEHLMATKQPAHLEYRVRRKDGVYIVVEDNGHFITDAEEKAIQMLGSVEDITERKQREEALRRSQEMAQALLNATHDLVYLVDTEGTLIDLNEAAAQSIGKSRVFT